MSGNTLDLGAEVSDLRRRVQWLEATLHGRTVPTPDAAYLVTMYLDAHRSPYLEDPALLRAACRQVFLLSVVNLVALGRTVRDDFPWRPFLALLDLCVQRSVEGAAEARTYLLDLARELMDLMGMSVLEPRDVMGSLRIQEAVSAISPR